MWEYCDTSALVKRYVDELGRPELMRLLRRYDCVTSALSLVELKGALRRRVAARHVAGVRVPELLTHVVEDRSYWTLVEVGAEVLRGAEALLSIHAMDDGRHTRRVSAAAGEPRVGRSCDLCDR